MADKLMTTLLDGVWVNLREVSSIASRWCKAS